MDNLTRRTRTGTRRTNPSKCLKPILLNIIIISLLSPPTHSQTISTNMPLPPMEWIKLTPSGTTSPPALSHGCLMGPTYTDSTSSLPGFNQAFLFGGRSAAGTSSNGLYILDYSSDQPVWSQPAPTVSTLFTSSPQSRSHLLCGWDSASNFRNQLNIYGGRSEDGQPLADFWYYDPTNRFWAQPKDFQPADHPASYGSIGGIDPSYLPAPPGTSNSIIYLGGSNSTHTSTSLTPAALSIDGQLGSNTNTVNVNLSSLASGLSGNPSSNNLLNGRWGATGTIMPGSKLVVFSGCNGDPANEFKDPVDPSCSLTNGGILSFESGFTASQLSTRTSPPRSSWAGFNYCPAPRVGGTMVANRNRFDSSYANQVIMIGGRTDSKNWDDQGGAKAGEVDVLDISSGVWARVLPMRRDNMTFSQKEGLLALALPSRIGASSASANSSPTDILVYGGIDTVSGQASNELWILRLHPAKLTGNGTADGISMTYMPSCATPTPQNKRNTTKTAPGGGPVPVGDDSANTLEAPSGHLLFSGLALAILMLSLTILRCEEPGKLSIRSRWRTSRLWLLIGAWHALVTSCGLLALAIVIGLFQTRVPTPALSLARRGLFDGHTNYNKLPPQDTLSQSTHSRLGLAIAVVGFVLVPGLYLLSWLDESLESRRKKHQQPSADGGPRKLKAKGAQRSGVTRRALERMFFLTRQSFAGSSSPKQQEHPRPSKEGSLGRKVESEKHGELVERRVSVPSSIDPSPKRPPLAVSGSQECLDSSSTSNTSTQLLSQTVSPPPAQKESLTSPSVVARKPSPSKLKLDLKKAERPVVRSPFAKVFHHLPGGLFSSSSNHDGQASPAGTVPSASPSPGFEVLNRRPPRRPRPRVSLDIMSDAESTSGLSGEQGRPSGTACDERAIIDERAFGSAEEYEEELVEEDEEEEEEEEDSVYKRRTKARRKLRRLADVILHTVVLVANIFFISSCLISPNQLRWLAALFIVFIIFVYSTILWLAWTGKPSSESTLVIFLSIIKDGSKSLMAHETLAGLGQFSSFQQQQQVAQQILSQQQQPLSGMGSSSVLGGVGVVGGGGMGVGKRSTIGSRLQGFSIYGGSQTGGVGGGGGGGGSVAPGGGGFFAGYPPAIHPAHEPPRTSSEPDRAEPLYDSHRLWAQDEDDFFRPHNELLSTTLAAGLRPDEPRDSYLLDREVQIVTTAPKRVLAVVNR
ncbi:hypothetical protein PGT21_022898 [Puccinia graminis f. sp. tritici]|uniref:Uncharacterized protein n=1 Tax=Puccinia graminis f. sp. tritici TaxID=56615 RepID=A0A5B0SJI8_PUCGR|nr:hypothetical protein PGT21_022898 [Puccinia graminis f. sp. tritici]KAA1137323.1 hypothetical protein PGTUg99_007385 [Puccinia graminis f. sp. tritici]